MATLILLTAARGLCGGAAPKRCAVLRAPALRQRIDEAVARYGQATFRVLDGRRLRTDRMTEREWLRALRSLPRPMLSTVVFLTAASSTSYATPADWNNSSNTLEAVGCGGNGHARQNGTTGGSGGGGGAYAKSVNQTLNSGQTNTIQVKAGGGANVTKFTRDDATLLTQAANGGNATLSAGGSGGLTTNCTALGIGSIKSGGGGGVTANTATGGGGGGAGGPSGGGGAGSLQTGGAADNATVTGGSGGDPGGSGQSGTEFDASHGCGSGGGGSNVTSGNSNGGAGGNYGGGGGGSNNGSTATGGGGGDGLLVVTYTPSGFGLDEEGVCYVVVVNW